MATPSARYRAPMSPETYRTVLKRLAEGQLQHDIAADLGVNQGRISEINTGKRCPGNDNQPSLL